MRELQEFTQWVNDITEASVRDAARKKASDYRDREKIKSDGRLNKARRLFPGVSDEEAILRLTDLYRQEQLAALDKANKEHEQTDGQLRKKNFELEKEVHDLELEVSTTGAINKRQEQEIDKAEDEISQLSSTLGNQVEINQRQQRFIQDIYSILQKLNATNDTQYNMAAESKAVDVMASLRDVVIEKQNK